MCNNMAVVSKGGDFDTLISRFKLGLAFGRKNGQRGTGFVHNGRRKRSHDYKTKNGLSYPANHDSLDFLRSNFFLSPTKGNYNIMMGHNRAPSAGMGYGAQFTHPFEYGEEVEVELGGEKKKVLTKRMWFQHNGTIKNIEELCAKFGYKFKDFGNDSYALGQMIYDGVDPAEIFKEYEGAATCIWYFEKDGRLNIWKGATINNLGKQVADRQLYMLKLDDQIWFNTERFILKIQHDFKHADKIEEVPINTIITVYKNLTLKEKKVDRKVYLVKPKAKNASVINFPPPKDHTKKKEEAFKPHSFRDNRFAFNQVVWYCGLYYINNILAFGVHRINENSKLDPEGEEYAFWNGRLLKDVRYFADAFRNNHVRTDYLHPRALHNYKKRNKTSLRWRFDNRKMVNHKVSGIMWHSYTIEFKDGKMMKGGVYDASHKFFTVNKAPFSSPVKWVRNFNQRFGTEHMTINECMRKYLNFMDLKTTTISRPHVLHKDFTNICEGNDFLFDNVFCEIYNDVQGTSFFSTTQCLHHFASMNDFNTITNNCVREFCAAMSNLFDGEPLREIKEKLQLV